MPIETTLAALRSLLAGAGDGDVPMMNTPPQVQSMATRLLDARQSGQPVLADAASGPIDTDASLAVQSLVASKLGPVGGFKTGRRASDDALRMAPMPAADMHADGAAIPQRLPLPRMVELEIGFCLSAPLPDPDAADFDAQLARAVTVHAALEIVQARIANADTAGPLWKLADALNNDAAVFGPPADDWQSLDLGVADVVLEVGGRTVAEGRLPVPGGCAFATFAAFARHVGTHCGGLQPGHGVITGSITGLTPVAEGDRVIGRIVGLGMVGCTVGAR